MKKLDKTLPERRETTSSWILEFMIAILMPPVAVLLNRGPGKKAFISLILTILGYFPGLIYTFYVLLSSIEEVPSDSEDNNLSEQIKKKAESEKKIGNL